MHKCPARCFSLSAFTFFSFSLLFLVYANFTFHIWYLLMICYYCIELGADIKKYKDWNSYVFTVELNSAWMFLIFNIFLFVYYSSPRGFSVYSHSLCTRVSLCFYNYFFFTYLLLNFFSTLFKFLFHLYVFTYMLKLLLINQPLGVVLVNFQSESASISANEITWEIAWS